MNSAVIRISTDRMIEIARNMSSTTAGSGRISTTRMVITPIASAMSPRLERSLSDPMPGIAKPPLVCPAVTSVIVAAPPNPVAVTKKSTQLGATRRGSRQDRLPPKRGCATQDEKQLPSR